MTNNDYARFLKIFGKLCKAYDVARADQLVHETLQANTEYQVSAEGVTNLQQIAVVARNFASWENTTNSGPEVEQALMLNIAKQLLALDDFYDALTTKPASRAPATVLAAWVTDMGLNSKTFLTLTTSGLVRFFNLVAGGTGLTNALSIPSAGSPTYADSVYVVSAFV